MYLFASSKIMLVFLKEIKTFRLKLMLYNFYFAFKIKLDLLFIKINKIIFVSTFYFNPINFDRFCLNIFFCIILG